MNIIKQELRVLSGNQRKITALLIINPQIDFHEGSVGETNYYPKGSLAVAGSHKDCHNIKVLIEENMNDIDDIVVTLDTHQTDHIAHAKCWKV